MPYSGCANNAFYATKPHDTLESPELLSAHATNNLPLGLTLPSTLAQAVDAAQVANHVTRLAKVDFLEQVAHLELHVLDEAADVGNVAVVGVDG